MSLGLISINFSFKTFYHLQLLFTKEKQDKTVSDQFCITSLLSDCAGFAKERIKGIL